MTEHHVEVFRVSAVKKHPHADTLSITNAHAQDGMGGYPVIFKTGTFVEGDLAVYVPIDSVMPDTEQWHFLAERRIDAQLFDPGPPVGSVPPSMRRIKPRRFRGIFSMGMLIPAPIGAVEGDDVASSLGIARWEPNDHKHGSPCLNEAGPDGWTFERYTDIEPLRRHWTLLSSGEEVICTEKVHGMNGRWCHDGTRLWVGSHTCIKRPDCDCAWSTVATQLDLSNKLARFPMMILFGEVYGRGAQDLTYGADKLSVVIFDVYDVKRHQYLDHDRMAELVHELGLTIAPVLYRGPWHSELMSTLCEGSTVMNSDATHVREGFVVKPIIERDDHLIGRVILKMVGEGFHMRSDRARRAHDR